MADTDTANTPGEPRCIATGNTRREQAHRIPQLGHLSCRKRMVGPDVARSRIVRQVAERGTFMYRVSDAHTKQVSNVKVQGAATSEPVIGMKEQRGGIPPHGRVRGSVWTDARRTQCTWIRTPLRHPAEAVHTHRREPKKKNNDFWKIMDASSSRKGLRRLSSHRPASDRTVSRRSAHFLGFGPRICQPRWRLGMS